MNARETMLRYPRTLGTIRAAKKFTEAVTTPRSTEGIDQYRMRSAMDLDPKLGKWISRRAVRVRDVQAGSLAEPTGSRFVDPAEIDAAVAGVRRDGYYVFSKIVDPSITDAMRSYAEQVPCIARGAGTPPGVYPRLHPDVGRYDIEETVALGCPEIQDFATDPGLMLIAQRYLGQPVLQDEVAFWWTTTKRAEDANLNAQLFHQDRDRLSFLKFFMYITNVTPTTGPHVYLRGSHLGIPRALRADGRKSDDAVKKVGLWHEVRELTGPAGTLMAVDTIGLHKGKTPSSADRLAIEIECATSLFGAAYEIPMFDPTPLSRERYAAMPWALQRYRASMGSRTRG